MAVLPARARKPRDKAKAEAGVLGVPLLAVLVVLGVCGVVAERQDEQLLVMCWRDGTECVEKGGQQILRRRVPSEMIAVMVGAPAYLDGYAALPLTRGLIDHGMSQGAAMAFLVSGGVVSIWGAMAIFPVLRVKPFLLYLGFAIVGSMASGWIFEMFV